jgi:hypothetical protein
MEQHVPLKHLCAYETAQYHSSEYQNLSPHMLLIFFSHDKLDLLW